MPFESLSVTALGNIYLGLKNKKSNGKAKQKKTEINKLKNLNR